VVPALYETDLQGPVVVFTSPQKKNYHKIKKDKDARLIVNEQWSFDEVVAFYNTQHNVGEVAVKLGDFLMLGHLKNVILSQYDVTVNCLSFYALTFCRIKKQMKYVWRLLLHLTSPRLLMMS
jgi:hypothetical protein